MVGAHCADARPRMSPSLRHCPPSHFNSSFPPLNHHNIIDKVTSARRGLLSISIRQVHVQFLHMVVAHAWTPRCYCTLAAQTKQETVRLRANGTVLIPPRCFVPFVSVSLVVRLNHSCWLSVPDKGSASTDEGTGSSPLEPRQDRNARRSSAAGSARSCPPASREWPAVSVRPSATIHASLLTVSASLKNQHTSR